MPFFVLTVANFVLYLNVTESNNMFDQRGAEQGRSAPSRRMMIKGGIIVWTFTQR